MFVENRLMISDDRGVLESHWPQALSNDVVLLLMPVFVSLSKRSANGRTFYDILLKNIHCNTFFLVKWEKELDILETLKIMVL